MKGRPRKAKTVRKALRKNRSTSRKVAKPATSKRDPLDDFIAAGARALDLKIDKAWMPAVRGHLQVTLRLGALVAAFALPDDAEPAPVFKV
jgi:1-carboxybiuret hydrolase subunit AtzG-like